jgi:hypothetical protein
MGDLESSDQTEPDQIDLLSNEAADDYDQTPEAARRRFPKRDLRDRLLPADSAGDFEDLTCATPSHFCASQGGG